MSNILKSGKSFLAHCQYEKNLSVKTLKSYSTDLKQFVFFLNEKGHSQETVLIDKSAIRSYLQHISGFKPKTVKRKIATIKALFNFLEFEDVIPVNPFRKMRIQIKEPSRLPNVMTIQEVEKVISMVYTNRINKESTKEYTYLEGIRSIAVIELLFASGARVSEISHLKADKVNLKEGLIRVKGKGNKERLIQICNKETILALNHYARLFKPKFESSGGYFFVNRFGKRLSEQSIRFLVKKQALAAGLSRKITPHVFRHSFATLLLEQDVDIKYIQHLLGHSSIMTTQIYTHVNSEKQKQILQKHPRQSFHLRRRFLVS